MRAEGWLNSSNLVDDLGFNRASWHCRQQQQYIQYMNISWQKLYWKSYHGGQVMVPTFYSLTKRQSMQWIAFELTPPRKLYLADGFIVHQDNAFAHRARLLQIEILEHPPYSWPSSRQFLAVSKHERTIVRPEVWETIGSRCHHLATEPVDTPRAAVLQSI